MFSGLIESFHQKPTEWFSSDSESGEGEVEDDLRSKILHKEGRTDEIKQGIYY